MKLVDQNRFDEDEVASTCSEFGSGVKNFSDTTWKIAHCYPALEVRDNSFLLTLHPVRTAGSPTVGFASGRFHMIPGIGDAAVIEVMGILPMYRGFGAGIDMYEFLAETLDTRVAAAYVQTPASHAVWLRLARTKVSRLAVFAVCAGKRYRIKTKEDIEKLPFDLYQEKDSTFFAERRAKPKTQSPDEKRRRRRKCAPMSVIIGHVG